jgi:hypothetical protein
MELDNTNTGGPLRGWKTFVGTSALKTNIDSGGPGTTGSYKLYDKIFIMEDRYESTYKEFGNITPTYSDISLSLKTKVYDVGLSHRFKRLMHWGVDCVTGRDVTGILLPFSVAYRVTWEQLHQYRWSQLNTWAYPLFETPNITQAQPVGSTTYRRFIRFPKSLRFRLLQLQVDMITSGNTVDGPARLYTITAFISQKQLVPKAVN